MKANSPGHARRGVNYYNEFDKFAAGWLRELIKAGLIPAGDVDDRSIKDVQAGDLLGYTQCHFFAGIGGWPLALQLAGWRTDRPVWSGSCPCQPFSAAGRGDGFADDRHLWPEFHRLIGECRPAVVFGEQVATSKAADAWFDLVQADVEALGYAFGVVAFPAASVGAPHIRDRAYWVANNAECGRGQECKDSCRRPSGNSAQGQPARFGTSGGSCGLADHDRNGFGARGAAAKTSRYGNSIDANGWPNRDGPASPLHGFWSDADWLLCRDGKWRPVEPGTFPLAHGIPNRVGRLRGYGNAIVPQQAAEFVSAFMDYQRAVA